MAAMLGAFLGRDRDPNQIYTMAKNASEVSTQPNKHCKEEGSVSVDVSPDDTVV